MEETLKNGMSVNLNMLKWQEVIAKVLSRGYVITIDYGIEKINSERGEPLRVYGNRFDQDDMDYHPERYIFVYPGVVDMTSDVDFLLLAAGGDELGLRKEGATGQYSFFCSLYRSNINLQRTADDLSNVKDSDFFVLIQSKDMPATELSGLKLSTAPFAEGGMMDWETVRQWIAAGDIAKLAAHITRSLQGKPEADAIGEIDAIVAGLSADGRQQLEAALKARESDTKPLVASLARLGIERITRATPIAAAEHAWGDMKVGYNGKGIEGERFSGNAASATGMAVAIDARGTPINSGAALVQERLDVYRKSGMRNGSGWMAISATPQQALDFHRNWTMRSGEYFEVSFRGNIYKVPNWTWQKMKAWVEPSPQQERNGYFIGHVVQGGYEIIDFIPQGSFVYDPFIDGLVGDQGVSSNFSIWGQEACLENNIDLHVGRQLEFRAMTAEMQGVIEIPVHSHPVVYFPGPSENDKRAAGGTSVVYCLEGGVGFLYDKTDHIQIQITESSVVSALPLTVADNLLERLSINPGDRVISVGPGLPNDPTSNQQSSDIPWEWFFVTRGAAVQVFDPEPLANTVWQRIPERWAGQPGVLNIELSEFPKDKAEKSTAKAVVMMGVLSMDTISVTARNRITLGAARALVSGGYLIVGWHNSQNIVTGEEQRTMEQMEYLKSNGYQLSEVAKGIGLPNTHNWICYQVGPMETDVRTTGGIDFRSLPIVTQAISNLSASLGTVPLARREGIGGDSSFLEAEWRQIEQMSQAGIRPSAERIKEYLQASCYKGKVEEDKDRVVLCISGILRQEEEEYIPTEPMLRDILVVLEAGYSAAELRAAFTGTAT